MELVGEINADLAAVTAELQGRLVDRRQERSTEGSQVGAAAYLQPMPVPVPVRLAAVDTHLGNVDWYRAEPPDQPVKALQTTAIGGLPRCREGAEARQLHRLPLVFRG